MDILDFKAKKRETVGVGPAKALRRDGRIPAVLYGPKTAPMKLSVDTADFQKLLKLNVFLLIKWIRNHRVAGNRQLLVLAGLLRMRFSMHVEQG